VKVFTPNTARPLYPRVCC